MDELTPINCRDTVYGFVLANSRLFIHPGPSTMQCRSSQEPWGLTEKVEPMFRDSVPGQEPSQSHQRNVEPHYQSPNPYSDMNGVQSYSSTQSSSLDLTLASTDFSETEQLSYSQYNTIDEYDQSVGIEGRSPKNTPVQDVLEFGTAAEGPPIADFDFGREPSIEQGVSVKRGYVGRF